MADQYYRFFPGDYQRDTGDLTLLEHGAYRILLDHYYMQGFLPSDPQRLYRLCRAFTVEEQVAIDMIISRFFFEVDGELKNRKAEEELDKRRTFLEEQARKSRLAVEARGNRKRTPQGNPVDEPTGQPTDKPDGVPLPSPSPSPLPTPSPKKQESVNTLSSFAGQKTTGKNGNCPHEEIINLYHEVLPELPGVRTWPENNRKILRTRWKEEPERQNLAWWRSYFEYIRESQFLMGREKDWMANLEWIVRPKNMTKILNGSYHKQRHGGIQAWLNQTENNSQPS